MPKLRSKPTVSPQHAEFVRLVAGGMDAGPAYRQAMGGEPTKNDRIHACRCLQRPQVAALLEKARAKVEERAANVAADSLAAHLEQLAKLRDEAKSAGQYGPAVSAEVSRGKVQGHYTEKHEHSGPNGGAIPVEHKGLPEVPLETLLAVLKGE